ncbi:MAG: prepilin-type N-terminal cleavage/methylation domain-containing protein [Desulfatitalea sp.]|nr:prepilin-type N-terminal cleavage/methylation domain-containing protein [Desulfatitalea sp.]NNK01425.1 prepilin-type N-terminal cleavage/methylation domain-containing protein [Desulfatitalea sp.]
MNNHRSRKARETTAGFTLLEILLAMVVLSIVMGLIFSSFDGVFSDAGHIRSTSDIHETAQACLQRLSLDLQAIHVSQAPRYTPPDIHDETPDIYRVEGDNETAVDGTLARLRFTSLAHLPLGGDTRQGIAEIVYYTQQAADGSYELRRADRLYPYPEAFEPSEADALVCDQVRSFKLLFFDRENREFEAWNSQDDDLEFSTPTTISVELKVGDETSPYEFETAVTLPMQRQYEAKR